MLVVLHPQSMSNACSIKTVDPLSVFP